MNSHDEHALDDFGFDEGAGADTDTELFLGRDVHQARTNARLDTSGGVGDPVDDVHGDAAEHDEGEDDEGEGQDPDAGGGGGEQDEPAVWDFTALTGAAEKHARSQLQDWVTEILDGWYALVGEDQASGTEYRRLRVPACWDQHPDVRIELGWLAQEWLRAYRDEGGDLHAAAEWHTRYLPAAVDRIRKTSTACACAYGHKALGP